MHLSKEFELIKATPELELLRIGLPKFLLPGAKVVLKCNKDLDSSLMLLLVETCHT